MTGITIEVSTLMTTRGKTQETTMESGQIPPTR